MLVRLLKPPHAPCPRHLLLDRQRQKFTLSLRVLEYLDYIRGQFTPTFDGISHFY
jgi:hypothetical protein